jgi:hypothetical protein
MEVRNVRGIITRQIREEQGMPRHRDNFKSARPLRRQPGDPN